MWFKFQGYCSNLWLKSAMWLKSQAGKVKLVTRFGQYSLHVLAHYSEYNEKFDSILGLLTSMFCL